MEQADFSRGVDNEWANLVDIASLTVQPGSMEAVLLCEHVKILLSAKTTVRWVLHIDRNPVCKF
jgi:hypothetical protein